MPHEQRNGVEAFGLSLMGIYIRLYIVLIYYAIKKNP